MFFSGGEYMKVGMRLGSVVSIRRRVGQFMTVEWMFDEFDTESCWALSLTFVMVFLFASVNLLHTPNMQRRFIFTSII